ncbi:probable NADH dehydrogenase [ubiquinone] iron-sulfur protein 6, mitochondrial [Anastrepha obliqua]|uniref:probable NADH dehydrogenase [ubiquinone] iron-sulfur protein 6, mitochondrial n=1 Tax=Anastrepha obliqua TaxID=95512 RepID=UPI00240A6847|nr:probable NADH dehydrogenase [ubiquinone] iron-sulfur protein 6, mitochondrial [Anastrepha obliqua]
MNSSIFFKYMPKFKVFAKIQPHRLRSDLSEVTHTGQVWAEDDYRNVRFTNAKRWVNKNWGMVYAHQREPIICSERIVYCNGDGPLGHPISYICLDKPGKHWCHYCLKSFIREQKKK